MLSSTMRILLLISFFLTLLEYSWAGSVEISGFDSSYANQEIVFMKYNDQISGSEQVIGRTEVNSKGRFNAKFRIDKTTFVFAYLGIYKIHLFAIPESSYDILLPPRQDKLPGDLLNPYFSPTTVHLATRNYDKQDVNVQIRMFNDAYLPYYNKHILSISERDDFSELDKDIERMEKPFAKSENEYFNNYRQYKYGLLRHLAYQQRSRSISDEYFINKPVLLNNTSYMELFNQVYEKYFHHFSRTEAGNALAGAVRSNSFDSLRVAIATDDVLGTGNLPDLVILKSLHDEFYDDNYSRSTLLAILNDYISHAQDREMLALATSIHKKVTRLLIGFKPPEFALLDKDSNLIHLDDLKGRYVYLNFCSCFSYTCMSEFKMLSTLADKHKEILEVVTIIIDDDPDVISGFLERSQYTWKFLHYANQSTIIRDYDVRALPTYYLLDKQGKLAISPAPSPGDQFETHLFKLLRSRKEL